MSADVTSDPRQVLMSRVRDIADFPKPGVVFKDLNPLFADAAAFATVLADIGSRWMGKIDLVSGIEARGLIVGAPLAQHMQVGFLPVRKAGKLPGMTLSQTYDLEYGTATIEVPADACSGQRVLLIDDVLATGGTAAAAAALLERAGAEVVGVEFLLEILFLQGRKLLAGHQVFAVASS